MTAEFVEVDAGSEFRRYLAIRLIAAVERRGETVIAITDDGDRYPLAGNPDYIERGLVSRGMLRT